MHPEFASLDTLRAVSPQRGNFNALISGKYGSGKTYLIGTAPKPIFIDCFDPGGMITLERGIEAGDIYADTRWEDEDPMDPSVYLEWAKEFNRRGKSGFFNEIATYAIDSLTTWQKAILNHVMHKAGMAGEEPSWGSPHDQTWGPQKRHIRNNIRKILKLPCNVIMTAHLMPKYKEVGTGKNKQRILVGHDINTTGALRDELPSQFAEVYVMQTKKVQPSDSCPSGIAYNILTQSTGLYDARSRLAANGNILAAEAPDLKGILRKAGYPTEDRVAVEDEVLP